MKKIIICLLSLGLIAGCTQQSPAEEPVSGDNEQNTIEYLNKIDDDKDYVYLLGSKHTTSDDSDYRKLEEDYPFTDFDTSDLMQWMAIYYSPNPIYEQIVVNIDSPDAAELNQYFDEIYQEENRNGLYNEYRWHQSDDILMIYQKYGTFMPFAGEALLRHKAYYIDLHTGERLSNDDLLSLFSVQKEDIDDIILKYAIENKLGYAPANLGDPIPHEELDDSNGTIMSSNEYFLEHEPNFSSTGNTYNDTSALYVEDNHLYLIVGVITPSFNNHYLFHKILLDRPVESSVINEPDQSEESNENNAQSEDPIQILYLNGGKTIELYQTTYPHHEEQLLKEDYVQEDSYLPYERIGAQKLVFSNFNDPLFDQLNQENLEKYNQCINSVQYHDYENNPSYEGYLSEFDILFYDIYENNDVISIVETYNHVLWESGGLPYQYRIFNIDKNTGELLSNSDLIEDYDVMSAQAENVLQEMGILPLSNREDMSEETDIFYYGLNLENSDPAFNLPFNDESYLYQKDNEWFLFIELHCYGPGGRLIRLKVDYPV